MSKITPAQSDILIGLKIICVCLWVCVFVYTVHPSKTHVSKQLYVCLGVQEDIMRRAKRLVIPFVPYFPIVFQCMYINTE